MGLILIPECLFQFGQIALRPMLVVATPLAIPWGLLYKGCEEATAVALFHDHNKYSTSRTLVGHMGVSNIGPIPIRDNL